MLPVSVAKIANRSAPRCLAQRLWTLIDSLQSQQTMTVAHGQEIPGTNFSVRVERGGHELVEPVASQWRQLCDESGDEEVFYRPEWAQAYLCAFEPKADVIIISALAGGQLRGTLPLVWRRNFVSGLPVVQLTLPANFHSLPASLPICPGEEC